MKINDNLYGFTVTKVTPVDELCATAYEMEYQKNGCKLLWLDRPDENKTFAITFKTIPWDNTGVFHILEHSVLCGSDKYPLKEPFVDLLKSSMQTFLNAMTFLDKTMYPVSSRNDKDLLNLIDVYMDAVFNPLIHSKKEIFMQEGWHIEEDENGEWSYNGVVYNEMRGVFSSVDSLMIYKLLEKLFPNTCYGCESGGAPLEIPDLTYEKFTETHKKFYHPSNATIFLDGMVDLDTVLPLLASYIEKYDGKPIDFDIEIQNPVHPEIETVPYEVGEDDDAIGKTEIAKGYVFADYTQKKEVFAASILCDILTGSNDAPLKKALFEKGLAEDVYFSGSDDTKQRALFFILRGVPQGREAEAEKVINDEIAKLVKDGIPENQLVADINITEFAMKEQDFGTTPAGLIFAMKAQESWLHGGNPVDSLTFNDCFKSLRESVGTDYYEKLLERIFLTNNHQATVYMVPNEKLAENNQAAMKQKMAELKANTSDADKEVIYSENEKLKLFQETPDTPEMSALVPHLELSDISKEVKQIGLEIGEINGVKTITAQQPINEIIYTDLYFDLSGFSKEEIWLSGELSSVLSQCKTTERSALEFSTLVKTYMGSFSTGVTIAAQQGNLEICTPYFHFNMGALEENKDKIVELFSERVFKTVFEEKRVLEILKQDKLSYETSLKESGNRHAGIQVKSCLNAQGVVNEILSGETSYNYIVKYISDPAALVSEFDKLIKKIATKQRLTACIVGKERDDLLADLIDLLPDGNDDMTSVIYPLSTETDKRINIASDVSYAAKAVNVFNYCDSRKGEFGVATKLLSLEYLWNEVRVKGGAYGCSCGCLPDGCLLFSSYRDPNPDNTINVYNNAGEALRKIANECDDLTKYIIGTISASEPVQTPYAEGKAELIRYLNGISTENRNCFRKEILETNKESLLEIADVFDKIESEGVTCVVGKK